MTGKYAMSLTSHAQTLLDALGVDAKWFLIIGAVIAVMIAAIALAFPSTALALVVLKIIGPF